ncbi:hypothetical protein SLE2022_115350 [Rubroshorea leprosula]
MLDELSKTGESRSSVRLNPRGMAKQEEGETRGGEIGSEGGGIDLNFGTSDLVSAMQSDNDDPPMCLLPPPSVIKGTSPVMARRSMKEKLK